MRARSLVLLCWRWVEPQLLLIVLSTPSRYKRHRDGDEHPSALHAGVDEGEHRRVDPRGLFSRSRSNSPRLDGLALPLDVRRVYGEGGVCREGFGEDGRGGRDGLEGELKEGAGVEVKEDERSEELSEGRFCELELRSSCTSERADVDFESCAVDELVSEAHLDRTGETCENGYLT